MRKGLATILIFPAPFLCFGQTAVAPFAGTGPSGFSGDGGPATSARLSLYALGLATDSDGNVYIADLGNHRVRKVNTGGTISTVAGNGSAGATGDGGPALSAPLFSGPVMTESLQGMAVDGAGNLYIPDSFAGRVRKVTPDGTISLFAGGGLLPGDGGPANRARLDAPTGVAVDLAGNVYIAENLGSRVRKVDKAGIITTIAGTGLSGGGLGDGGPATSAQVAPQAVAVDSAGNVYIYDVSRIRKVNTAGIITTVVGTGKNGGPPGDGGPATSAELMGTGGLAIDGAGNLFLTDVIRTGGGSSRPAVRKVNTAGIISTIVTAGVGNNISTVTLGDIAVDRAGNVYFTASSIVYKIGGAAAPGPAAPPPPPPSGTVTRTVSAASQQDGPVAAESIVIATGTRLATGPATADYDRPPNVLGGTTINVTDSAGVSRPAAIFSVSATQVVYQMPPGTAAGTATVTITAGDGVAATTQVQIAAVAPGIYALNSAGLARGYVLRTSNGNLFVEDVFDIDATGALVARPITISNGDQVTLLIYGTGFRAAGGDVSATAAGNGIPVLYAGPQGVQPGLDQLNVMLPPELAAGGAQSVPIVLTASGQTANTVYVTVQ